MKNFTMSILAPVALWLAGCSHMEVDEIPITANPSEEISKLEAEQSSAASMQADVLAPEYYAEVSESLRSAKDSRDAGKDSKVIHRYVAEGRAHLVKVNDTVKIANSTIPQVVEQRANALAANANKVMKDEFAEVDEDLIEISNDIEDGELSAAEQGREKLAIRYADIELRAIKKENLGAAITTIEQAKKEGATENAPKTLADATEALKAAENYINANRHNQSGVETQAKIATDAANRVLNISRQAKVADKNDSESVVLDRESQNKQLDAAATAAEVKNSELAAASEAKSKLASENDKLERQSQDSARLDSAKSMFSPGEADVYRDGNRLVIRLKTLSFPTGKATLPPASFPVLGKVQKIIQELGPSRITVEGHTDSVGSKVANQTLSETRAAAISSYLSSNGIDPSSIDTIGFGDTKPLAANNTAAGKAQNRRVDIVVTPIASTH